MSSSKPARSVIALCESGAQVARLAGDSAIAGDVTTWVSANPAAAWALERRRLPFVPLENFDDGSLREHVEPLIAEQISWAERLDETLQREVPDFRSANFRPTRHSLYHIKNFWDTIVHRGTMLTRLADELKPTRVYHFANTVPLHLGSEVRGLVGSVLADVVPEWAAKNQIEVVPVPGLRNDAWWTHTYERQGVARLRAEVAELTRRLLPAAVTRFLRSARRTRRALRYVRHTTKASSGPVVFVQSGYDLNDEFWRNLTRLGYSPIELRTVTEWLQPDHDAERAVAQLLSARWDDAVSCGLMSLGCWQHLPVQQSVERLLRQFWIEEIPRIWGLSVDAWRKLEAHRPKAIVASTIYYDRRDIACAAAARGLGIPVITYQHGGTLGDVLEPWDIAERYVSDALLVYGEGPLHYLQHRPHFAGVSCRAIAVGSARLDTAKAMRPSAQRIESIRRAVGVRPGHRLVVFVPDVLHFNFFRLGGSFRECNQRRFETRRRLAAAMQRLDNVHFAFKSFLVNSGDPTTEMIRLTCPRGRVVNEIGLTDLQWAADLMVYETVSTGLLEGTLTDRPLIVRCDRSMITFASEALDLIAARAQIAFSDDQLIEAVCVAAQGPLSESADDGYRRAFGTHNGDGGAASRAAASTIELIRECQRECVA